MILGIDTITEKAGVFLGSKEASFFDPLETKHASDSLIGLIERLIKEAGTTLNELKGVMVVKGPGSFTGVRVGVAVANQFSHQLNIPILGITTDELFDAFTDEPDTIYLQTMNRDQVYMVGKGALAGDFPFAIVSASEAHSEISSGRFKFFGQLSEAHQSIFADLEIISDLADTKEAWIRLAGSVKWPDSKKYHLVEPFYGKEPTITVSKKKLEL